MSIPIRTDSASWSQVSWANRWASLKALFLLRDGPLSFPRIFHLSSGQTWPIRGRFQAQHCPLTSCVTGQMFFFSGVPLRHLQKVASVVGELRRAPNLLSVTFDSICSSRGQSFLTYEMKQITASRSRHRSNEQMQRETHHAWHARDLL